MDEAWPLGVNVDPRTLEVCGPSVPVGLPERPEGMAMISGRCEIEVRRVYAWTSRGWVLIQEREVGRG